MWETILVIACIILAVSGAIAYIIKTRKSGKSCVGCPCQGECSSRTCSKGKNEKNFSKNS